MPTYEVTFKLISSYEDEDENLEEIVTQTYDAESEEALDTMLEDDTDWNDECVVNWDAKSELIESIRDWVSTKEIK